MRRLLFCSFLALVVTAAGPRPEEPVVVRVTRDGSFKQHLHFSPDGKRLLFTRIHKGLMSLWTVNLDGTDLKPLLTPPPNAVDFDGHFSPDGKLVVFVHDVHQGTDGKLQINRCDADGKNSKVLIPHKAF